MAEFVEGADMKYYEPKMIAKKTEKDLNVNKIIINNTSQLK